MLKRACNIKSYLPPSMVKGALLHTNHLVTYMVWYFVLAAKQTLLSIVFINDAMLRPFSDQHKWIKWPHSPMSWKKVTLRCSEVDVLKSEAYK